MYVPYLCIYSNFTFLQLFLDSVLIMIRDTIIHVFYRNLGENFGVWSIQSSSYYWCLAPSFLPLYLSPYQLLFFPIFLAFPLQDSLTPDSPAPPNASWFLSIISFFFLSFLRTPFSVVCHSSSFCQLKFNKNNPGRVTIFIRKIIYKEASLLFL